MSMSLTAYEFMTRDLDRKLASNKQLRKLEFIQADGGGREDASLSAINERGRRVVRTKDLSVKQLVLCIYMYICVNKQQSNINVLSTGDGGKRHARGTRESASGGACWMRVQTVGRQGWGQV